MTKRIIVVLTLFLTLMAPTTLANDKANITGLNSNYSKVISRYINAMTNNWNESKLIKNNMYQFMNVHNFTTANCGYFTHDLDGNGVEELLIVHQAPEIRGGENSIIDLYTLEGNSLKQIFYQAYADEIMHLTSDGRFLTQDVRYDYLYHLNGSKLVQEAQRSYNDLRSQFPPIAVSYYSFNMLNVPSGDGTPIYRTYNAQNGEHLYTSDLSEAATLMSRGWNSEGVSWIAPGEGTSVYRLASPDGDQHLYTTDENEVSELTSTRGWTTDNGGQPIFYSGGDIPIYRLYDSRTGQHLLTKDGGEYNSLPTQGWIQEGAPISALS